MTYVISGLGSTEKMEDIKLAQAVQNGTVDPSTAVSLKQAQASWDGRALVLRKSLSAGMTMSPSQVESTIVRTIGPRPSIAMVPKIQQGATIPTKVGRVGPALKFPSSGGFKPGPGAGLPDMPVGEPPPGGDTGEGEKDNTMLYVGGALALIVVGAMVMRK